MCGSKTVVEIIIYLVYNGSITKSKTKVRILQTNQNNLLCVKL